MVRFPRQTAVLLALAAVAFSCGDSSDPLVERCETACNNVSAPSPCANDASKSKCLNDCRALASQAQTSNGKSCGECIAESFRYSAKPGCENDPTCCWGTAHASPTDDTCKARCFEPDAGVAW